MANETAVAEKIRGARLRRGWSQDRLASMAGVSRPTVARIEAGQGIGTDRLEKVAESLGLRVDLVAIRD